MSKRRSRQILYLRSRHWISIGVFACLFAALLYKMVLFDEDKLAFLRDQAEKRIFRYQQETHSRGDILDSSGRPVAVSTRVFTLYSDPRYYNNTVDNASIISELTGLSSQSIIARIDQKVNSRYVVLKRNLTPVIAEKIEKINIDGIYLEANFKRFYPVAETVAQIIGYTNSEGDGIEGIELAFNDWLRSGVSTRKVIVDGRGKVIKDFGTVADGQRGKDLILSIDLRMQELAYRVLQKQVRAVKASHGAIVMIDPYSGEVLALAGYPSFNPNNRLKLKYEDVRNRVFTDAIEPGSTMKPFTVAAALGSGQFDSNSIIDTGKSRFFAVGTHKIADTSSYGKINLEQLIVKSSNIGAARIGLALGSTKLLELYKSVAFNSNTGSYFPGEVEGTIPYGTINKAQLATLSYGYGLKITLAQIARAYSVLANDGYLVPLSLLRNKQPRIRELVLDAHVAKQLRSIMSLVTLEGGTAQRASIKGYSVAGKTGTIHKYINNQYSSNKYISLFAGMAPADNPKLVAVIMIDEPDENRYYGGEVAAPVFSEVVGQSLRLLQITPDA